MQWKDSCEAFSALRRSGRAAKCFSVTIRTWKRVARPITYKRKIVAPLTRSLIRLFTSTGASGQAQFEFDMPRLAGGEPALVIEASKGDARGHLRFQLRGKPRVPSAS